MEVLKVLSQIPVPVIAVFVLALSIVTFAVAYQYAKMKGLDGLRKDVYQLILYAEHIYEESGQGEHKLRWVVQQTRMLMPKWLQIIVTEDMLTKVINEWFKGVKDLLDDGKVNGSQK